MFMNKNLKLNSKGFTFAEVLVSVIITMIVMLALVGLWVSSANFASSGMQETTSKNTTSNAINMMQRDLMQSTAVVVKNPGYTANLTNGFYPLIFISDARAPFHPNNLSTTSANTGILVAYCLEMDAPVVNGVTTTRWSIVRNEIANIAANTMQGLIAAPRTNATVLSYCNGTAGTSTRVVSNILVQQGAEDADFVRNRPLFYSLDSGLSNVVQVRLPSRITAGDRTINILNEKMIPVPGALVFQNASLQ